MTAEGEVPFNASTRFEMSLVKKPFKVLCAGRKSMKGVVAGSLAELVDKARVLFELEPLKIVLDEDGTEVVEDDYLMLLDDNSKLVVLGAGQQWTAPLPAFDVTDHPATEYNPVKILQKLFRSPGSIVLLSEEELETVSSCAVGNIGIPDTELECLREACQRQLDEKKRVRDALDLVELYQRAKQSNVQP